MARTSAMADIDQYISDSNATAPVAIDANAPTDAVMAPVIAPETSTTIQQEPAPTPDVEEERQSIKDMRAAQVEAARQRAEESEAQQKTRQAVEGVSDAATTLADNVRANAGKVTTAIAGVPIPGDLILPLSILLIFFFILIVVNGHTRLMWLWLTLTGNASLTTGGGASFATTPVTGTPLSPLTTTPTPGLPTLSNTLAPLPSLPPVSGIFGGLAAFGTFAEEIL